MAERSFCDRCKEPIQGECYELFILPRGGSWDRQHYRGDMCKPCYAYVAPILALPPPKGRLFDMLDPGLMDCSVGEMWKRLWQPKSSRKERVSHGIRSR